MCVLCTQCVHCTDHCTVFERKTIKSCDAVVKYVFITHMSANYLLFVLADLFEETLIDCQYWLLCGYCIRRWQRSLDHSTINSIIYFWSRDLFVFYLPQLNPMEWAIGLEFFSWNGCYSGVNRAPWHRINVLFQLNCFSRFLFESGSVKIISRCPKWWTMTAFGYHFETMPLPTRLGYYSHYSPKSCQMLTSIFVNLVELVFSWIIFVPSAKLRLAVFHLQVNYNLQVQ